MTIQELMYERYFDFAVGQVIEDVMSDVMVKLYSADPDRGPLTPEEIIRVIHCDHPHEWEELREEILNVLVSNRITHWLSGQTASDKPKSAA